MLRPRRAFGYFGRSSLSQKALLDAASQAGLRVLQVVDEGDSVASFAAQDDVACDSVVVLDVGGTRAKATSYTRHATGILERAKCQDDASLSGDAFTSCLYDFAATFLRRRQKIDVDDGGARAKRKLRDACARAAKLLANGAAQADVEADALVDGMDARARVTRARFEDLEQRRRGEGTIIGGGRLHWIESSLDLRGRRPRGPRRCARQ